MYTLDLVSIETGFANEITGALLDVNNNGIASVLDLDDMTVYQGEEHKVIYTSETVDLDSSIVTKIITANA